MISDPELETAVTESIREARSRYESNCPTTADLSLLSACYVTGNPSPPLGKSEVEYLRERVIILEKMLNDHLTTALRPTPIR